MEDEHTKMVDTGTQYDIENQDDQTLIEEGILETESDTTSEDFNSSFYLSSQSKGKLFENQNDADDYCNSRIKVSSVIMVYSLSLMQLPQNCITCSANATVEKLI